MCCRVRVSAAENQYFHKIVRLRFTLIQKPAQTEETTGNIPQTISATGNALESEKKTYDTGPVKGRYRKVSDEVVGVCRFSINLKFIVLVIYQTIMTGKDIQSLYSICTYAINKRLITLKRLV